MGQDLAVSGGGKPSVMPTRRDLRFALPAARIGDWHGGAVHLSHYFNAMSLMFPDGERFFIHAVRNYREQIRDPQLLQAVNAFIGQEAMHGREHTDCNALLDVAGLPGAALQAFVSRLLEKIKRFAPKSSQLSMTIALEHLTAIMANSLLQDPRVLEAAEPHFARLWRWHALEETEHKAVAYDVWCAVMGNNPLRYFQRVFALLATTVMFWPLVAVFVWRLTRADAAARREAGGWRRMLGFLLVSPGPLRRAFPEWLDYFKPGFHPWQHDNRAYLDGIAPLLRELEDSRFAQAA